MIWKMLPELLLHPHEAAASAPVPHIGHHQNVPLLRQVLGPSEGHVCNIKCFSKYFQVICLSQDCLFT